MRPRISPGSYIAQVATSNMNERSAIIDLCKPGITSTHDGLTGNLQCVAMDTDCITGIRQYHRISAMFDIVLNYYYVAM